MKVTESNSLISDKPVYREIVNLEKGGPRHCVEMPCNTEQVRMFHNSEWAYQRHRLCYKCDVSLWFYLYPCGFDTTPYEYH